MPHAENLNTGIFGSTIVDWIERSIMCCLHGWSAFVFRQTSTQRKDMPGEAVDPVSISLSQPLRNRRMGGVEAGRRRARFHRGRRAGRQGVQILPRRSIEKRTGGSLLLSQ